MPIAAPAAGTCVAAAPLFELVVAAAPVAFEADALVLIDVAPGAVRIGTVDKITVLEPTMTPVGARLTLCPETVAAGPPTLSVWPPTTSVEVGPPPTYVYVLPATVKTAAAVAMLVMAGCTTTPVGPRLTASPEMMTAGAPAETVWVPMTTAGALAL